jgi:AcrR family transcriptional regulator
MFAEEVYIVYTAAQGNPMRSSSIEAQHEHGDVLAAALRVFEREGFAATSVEDILAAAGIARRTFYRYFKSKDDVLAALYGMAMGEILAAIRDVRGEDARPLLAIHRAIDVYLDYHTKNAATLRVLLGQAMRPDSPLHAMRRSFRSALVTLLADVAHTRGKNLDPLVFVALVSAVEGLSFELLDTARGARKRRIEVARQTSHALLAKVFEVEGPAFPAMVSP